jgi:hypothetical protein
VVLKYYKIQMRGTQVLKIPGADDYTDNPGSVARGSGEGGREGGREGGGAGGECVSGLGGVRKSIFSEHFKLLKRFVGIHGHAHVPKSEGALGSWVETQRQLYHAGAISVEHRALLKSVGFCFTG